MTVSAVDERVSQLLSSAPLLYALAKDAVLSRGVWPDRCEHLIPPRSGLNLDGTAVAAALDDELGLLTPILNEVESWEWASGRDCSALLLRHADRFEDAVRTVVTAPAARWWWEPLHRDRQTWLTSYRDEHPLPFDVDLGEGFPDGTTPRDFLQTSTSVGDLPGVSLFFGWDGRAQPPIAVWSMPVGKTARVYEVTRAEDWLALCTSYPKDTTELRAESWAYDLGVRDRRIVTPAWHRVASDWDGVHLNVAGLLSTTCRVMALDPLTVTSVMRWHTEGTAWFHPAFGRPWRRPDWPGPLPYPG